VQVIADACTNQFLEYGFLNIQRVQEASGIKFAQSFLHSAIPDVYVAQLVFYAF